MVIVLSTRCGTAVAIAALLCLGIGLRLANLGNVTGRSPDQTTYTTQANVLLQSGTAGLRGLVEEYQRDPAVRITHPPPTRAGYLWLLAAAMRLSGKTDVSIGADISCAASIGSLFLLTLIGIRFFPTGATLFALLSFAVSPMELELARRAWADAVVEILALSLLWAAGEITRDPRRRIGYVLFVLLGCLGVAIKESGPVVFGLCTIGVLWVLLIERRDWKNALGLIAGGLAGMAVCFAWIATSVGGLSVVIQILSNWTNANAGNAYALEYQTGPGYLLLEAFWVLTPLPALLCLIGLAVVLFSRRKLDLLRVPADAANWQVAGGISLFLLSYIALPMILPHWLNLRYLSVVYGPYYLLAGVGFWFCVSVCWKRLQTFSRIAFAALAIALVAMGAMADYHRFQTMFVRNEVRDLSIKLVLDSHNLMDPAPGNSGSSEN